MKPLAALTLTLLAVSPCLAGDSGKKTVAPAETDRWKFRLASPGWMPSMQGDTGVNGLVSSVDLDPGDIIRRYDMVASLRGEASRGRFGIMGDFLYSSLSDGIGSDTVVKKVDLQVDQTIAELALRWRVIETDRWSVDVLGGVRYVNLFQQAVTQPNVERIDEASTALVDEIADRLRNALGNLGIGDIVSDRLRSDIAGFDSRRSSRLPIAPLGGRLGERLRARVAAIIGAREGELRARTQAVEAAVGAARATAQARLDELKQDISNAVAREVESKLRTRLARTDDWWDPFIGLRARYQINDRCYLTTKGDVGGFGVGSDFTWQAEAAFGFYVTPRVFTEIGYRAYGVDYEADGLTYDVVMHGAQVTLGLEIW